MERLNAYQCWKQKETQRLSDEEFKKLLINNGIINSQKDELETMLFVNMRGSVLGIMVRKGVYEITEDCVKVAKEYSNEYNSELLKQNQELVDRVKELEKIIEWHNQDQP